MKYLLYAEQDYAYAILRPMQKAILEDGGEAAWFLAGNEINPAYLGEDEPRLNSVEEVRSWQPEVIFSPGNFLPSFIPGLKVALFHGFNIAKATRTDESGVFNIRGCFDLYCTQGPETTHKFKALEEKYGHFRVIETGWPTLDPLFRNRPEKAEKEKPTLLYCSTFTPSLSSAPQLVDTIKSLSQSGRYHWLVQFHPKISQDIVNQYKKLQSPWLQFIETDDVLPLLQAADVMVSDTSSMIHMFLTQKKPVVTFRNQSRDKTLPVLNVEHEADLEDAIATALQQSPELMEQIDDFVSHTHPYHDGRSSQRVLQAVKGAIDQDLRANLAKKPLNLVRNLKERKRLGYWKLS